MTNKFYKGKEVSVMADVPGRCNEVIVKVVKDFYTTEYVADMLVNKKDLEPLVTDVFKLNDKVRRSSCGMHGYVTSFELSTNRVVVTSDKIAKYNNDRTRYAYKIDDLEIYDHDTIVLIPGCMYRINDKEELLAVQSVFESTEIMFFSKDGLIKFKGLAKKASLSFLNQYYQINSIKLIKHL
jgi:hypothetical protein